MNVEKLAEEYVRQKAMLAKQEKQVSELKQMLSDEVDKLGEPDEKGHRWLTAGKFVLQRQKRQSDKRIDRDKATEWAKRIGIWEEVMVVEEVLSEDLLLGFAFAHRNDKEGPHQGIEAELQDLYVTPDPTWAFMPPVEQKSYDY